MTKRTYHIEVPDHVENEAAYVAAAHARIQANGRKTRRAKWMAMPHAERALDFLMQDGEFDRVYRPGDPSKADEMKARLDNLDPGRDHFYEDTDLILIEYDARGDLHPVVKASLGEFRQKMIETVMEWGGLTEGQHIAVLAMIERAETRVAERAAKLAEAKARDAATSSFVAPVGERRVFDLTIRTVPSFETDYGTLYINIMADRAGNVVVYKGNKALGERGETVRVTATVKAHDVRDGVCQTIIARPKL